MDIVSQTTVAVNEVFMKESKIKHEIENRIKYHLPENFKGQEFEQCDNCNEVYFDIEYSTCKSCREL